MRIKSVAQLARTLKQMPEWLLAIDGFHGAGKTALACDLATQLAVDVVHLDEYLRRNQGGYVDFLQYQELADALRRRPLIVEGVCILAVLRRLDIAPDILIYVTSRKRRAEKTSHLAREVLEYHRLFEPSRVADVIYCRSIPARKGPSFMRRRDNDIDLAFIQAKTKIALVLASGGVLSLIVGLVVLMYGVTGQDHALLKGASFELSAGGLGGVIMATSGIWAFFAYKSSPNYRRTRQALEKYDAESRLIERREHDSASEALVEPVGRASVPVPTDTGGAKDVW